ncbi:hypothetical protein [Stutzerimonas stutzeri]|uniref:hypothetical protein n=1 Tax=Stutzerimonas stutzeri TaxID=316 RepID=UPI00244AF2F3|nr:hypothetical protein [Stutzerimonas stutzeri]MDH0424155.1 hypothetical protein [Stutzerimonas stutzeri]
MKSKIIAIALAFSSTAAFALSTADNLGAWRQASYSEKLQLAEEMANRLDKPNISASFLLQCVSETAADGGVDFMKISETAAACSILQQ